MAKTKKNDIIMALQLLIDVLKKMELEDINFYNHRCKKQGEDIDIEINMSCKNRIDIKEGESCYP